LVHSGKLPSLLSTFLSLPNIKKIGRGVKGDLDRLGKHLSPPQSFCGHLDLGHMAAERGLAPSKAVGLAELSARILHHHLEKGSTIRTSTEWERDDLPEQHQRYAALDVWASWCIYKRLISIPVPPKLSPNSPAGTTVVLWTEDHCSIAAYGHLADRKLKAVGPITLQRKTQTIITVTKVVTPATLLSLHKKSSLSSFGTVPFQVACLWRHLRAQDPATSTCPPPVPAQGSPPFTLNEQGQEEYQRLEEEYPGDYAVELGGGGGAQLGSLESDHYLADPTPPDLSKYELDLISLSEGKMLRRQKPPSPDEQIYSRVIKDLYHLMRMLVLPANHGLRRAFSAAFRDILLVPDPVDLVNIELYAKRMSECVFTSLRI
jgi:hypothetical protein